jgi:RNA polymerase sigma-70 factor (ECF subfamily)
VSRDPERALAERFWREGDEAAFRLLHRLHTPLLYRVAVRLAGGAAEEVVQEAWLRAARGLPAFRWESRLATWLVGIVVNCARERRREPPLADDAGLGEAAAPAARLDERIDLERALARLADGYRTVVVLHDVEGRSHEEIAAILGIEPGTSKSQLSRGRRLLRDWLGAQTTRRGP